MLITYSTKQPNWLDTKWVTIPTNDENNNYYDIISITTDRNHRLSSLDISDLFPSVAIDKKLEIIHCKDGYIVSLWNYTDLVEAILPDFPSVMEFIKDNT